MSDAVMSAAMDACDCVEDIACREWAACWRIVTYGVRVELCVNDPRALDRLSLHLPPGWKHSDSPAVDRRYAFMIADRDVGASSINSLEVDGSRLVRTSSEDELYETFESDLQLFVAEHARGRLFVHAGVVGWQGHAIVIPGRSLSGKSTLVQALVQAGATYYSDEYAVFDARGRVHAYPRPLSVRSSPGRPNQRYPVDTLGTPPRQPLLVGLVVVTRYQPSARWRPCRESSGRALLALVENAVPARSQPSRVLSTLGRAVAGVATLSGARAEADQAVPTLLAMAANPGDRAR